MRFLVRVDLRDAHAVISALEHGGTTVDRAYGIREADAGYGVLRCEGSPEYADETPGVLCVLDDPDETYPTLDALTGCDEPEPEPLPPLVGCDLVEGDEEMDD